VQLKNEAAPCHAAQSGCASEGDWARDGFLILRRAVSADQIERWTTALDALHGRFVAGAIPNLSQDKESATVFPPHWEWIDPAWPRDRIAFRRWRIVEDDPIFLEAVDHPSWMPILLSLFGPYLQVSLTHAVVYPPDAHDPPYLHVDGGDALGQMRIAGDGPPLSVKAMIFLTDLAERDCGNFSVVPGSHRLAFDPAAAERARRDSLVQLEVRAGDVVLFPHCLWHGPAPNRSPRSRKTLFIGYSPTFLRPYDYERIDDATLARATPRQRRLLGDLGGWAWRAGCHFYAGPDQAEVIGATAV
jgi:hypothetical protein